MTPKEYLHQLDSAESKIRAKKERLAVLREAAASTGAPSLSDMPRPAARYASKIEDMTLKIIDLEEEIRGDEVCLCEDKAKVLELIGALDSPEHQMILIDRYFRKMSWEEIAKELNFSERWVYTQHGRALQELGKIQRKENLE